MRKVFLDDLPRKEGIGALKGKQVIDWIGSVGYNIPFEYDSIKGEIEILGYDKKHLIIKYLNQEEFKIAPFHFSSCKLAEFLSIKTKKYKHEVGSIISDNKRDIEILKEVKIKNSSKKYCGKGYKVKCLRCGYIYETKEHSIERGDGCGVCCTPSKKIVRGINDIGTTHPEIVRYFANIEDVYKNSYGSNKQILTKCPECGFEKKCTISTMIYYGFGCQKCGDGKSYPEKFIFNLLEQLKINFETEKMLEGSRKLYDFYIPSLNLIIEAHGEQHYTESFYNQEGDCFTKDNERKNDLFKREYALKHGIKHYVTLDCRKSKLKWIKNSVLNSQLAELFNLSDIDWRECERASVINNSLMIKSCEYWNSGVKSTTDIGNIMKISRHTILKYLKIGAEIELCDYTKEESAKIKGENYKSKYKVMVVNTGDIFESAKELANKSDELFGVKFSDGKIRAVCSGTRKTHKGYTFKYVDKN